MTNIPAFPQSVCVDDKDRLYSSDDVDRDYGGMTLRDYFAGQYLVGHMHGITVASTEQAAFFARQAYLLADAMLQERDK